MKKGKIGLISFFSIMCLFPVGNVLGASVTSIATIDWDGLAVSSNLTESSYYYGQSSARADSAWLIDAGIDLTVDLQEWATDSYMLQEVVSGSEYGRGEGQTTAASLQASSGALALSPGNAFSGESYAFGGQQYLVDYGGGTVDFSIDYSFFQDLDLSGGDAYGYTQAWCSLERYDGENWVTVVSNVGANSLDDPFSDSLSITYDAGSYDYLIFRAGVGSLSAASAAAVPVPGAVWLVGSGLVGLAGLRKKLLQ